MNLWKRLFGGKQPAQQEQWPGSSQSSQPARREWEASLPEPQPKPRIMVPPMLEYRFIAFDVETATSFPASICQIGLATVDHQGTIQTYTTLIDPDTYFDDFNVNLHGISEHTVRGAPKWPQVWGQIAPILLRQPVVQHSNFDANAVKYACVVNNMDVPPIEWIDSVAIARRAWPDLRSNGGHGLANLRKHLNLSFRHHDAGEDAKAAACVVLEAERHLGKTFVDIVKGRAHPKTITREGAADAKHTGQTIVFTGEMSISRETAAEMASRCGFAVKASVSRKTAYLVVGQQDPTVVANGRNSTKELKAAEINAAGGNIQIIDEKAFLALYQSVIDED